MDNKENEIEIYAMSLPRKVFLFGLGGAALTKDKVSRLAHRMIERGEQARASIKKPTLPTRRFPGLRREDLPKKEQVAELNQQIAKLEAQIDELEQSKALKSSDK